MQQSTTNSLKKVLFLPSQKMKWQHLQHNPKACEVATSKIPLLSCTIFPLLLMPRKYTKVLQIWALLLLFSPPPSTLAFRKFFRLQLNSFLPSSSGKQTLAFAIYNPPLLLAVAALQFSPGFSPLPPCCCATFPPFQSKRVFREIPCWLGVNLWNKMTWSSRTLYNPETEK